jgi:spore germination protein KA
MASFLRILRISFMMISLLFPSLYVSMTTFQQEMIPTSLLLSIAAAREATPFPAVIEALIMELIFEALREAGVRMPKQIGQAMSIVGALVIGQAAVEAGIISAPMVIVVSITGIASFTFPRYNVGVSIRLLRFPMLLLAGLFGIYGMAIGLFIIIVHLVALRSFGVPYFTPVGPTQFSSLKDVFVRVPRWAMQRRQDGTTGENSLRIPSGQSPGPNRGNGPPRKRLSRRRQGAT